MLITPTIDKLHALALGGHGPGPRRPARASRLRRALASRSASACSSTARCRTARTAASPATSRPPGCAATRSSRTSTCGPPRARPRHGPGARRGPLGRGPPQRARHRAHRRGQDVPRLRPRARGHPARPHRALPARAAPARRARPRPGRRAAAAAHGAWARVDVLVLDDLGLQPVPSPRAADLLEVIEDRAGTRSTIVTSQLPVGHWHEALGEPTVADAILDRLVHGAYRLELEGDSMRRAQEPADGPAGPDRASLAADDRRDRPPQTAQDGRSEDRADTDTPRRRHHRRPRRLCQTTQRPTRGGDHQGVRPALASAAPRPPTGVDENPGLGGRKPWNTHRGARGGQRSGRAGPRACPATAVPGGRGRRRRPGTRGPGARAARHGLRDGQDARHRVDRRGAR